jgi:hypothetical protein
MKLHANHKYSKATSSQQKNPSADFECIRNHKFVTSNNPSGSKLVCFRFRDQTSRGIDFRADRIAVPAAGSALE